MERQKHLALVTPEFSPDANDSSLESQFWDLLARVNQLDPVRQTIGDPQELGEDSQMLTGYKTEPMLVGHETLEFFIYLPDDDRYSPSLMAIWKEQTANGYVPAANGNQPGIHRQYFSLNMLKAGFAKHDNQADQHLAGLEQAVNQYEETLDGYLDGRLAPFTAESI